MDFNAEPLTVDFSDATLWDARTDAAGYDVYLEAFKLKDKLIIISFAAYACKGYIHVGHGCWRPNVLVTRLRCWWPI